MGKLNLEDFRAVLFDLDMTLTNTHMYPVAASEWLLREAGLYTEENLSKYLGRLVSRYRNAIKDIAQGGPYRSPYEIILAAMGKSLEDIGHTADPELVRRATDKFRELHLEMTTVFPAVPDLLQHLTDSGLKLGVISNSFEGHAERILSSLNLRHFFEAVVDCGAVHLFKPMPQIFNEALRMLNVDAAATLFVGDEFYADIVGAKSLGMTAVWVNVRQQSFDALLDKHDTDFKPDFVVTSIGEFVQLL